MTKTKNLREAAQMALAALEKENCPTTQGDAADALRAALSLPEDDPDDICPACDGSGGSSYMSGAGPDAYEVSCDCPHCNGKGTLYSAYQGVCELLDSEKKKHMKACMEIWSAKNIPPSAPSSKPLPLTEEIITGLPTNPEKFIGA